MKYNQKQNRLKIAACPTCYEMAKNLDAEKYEIIITNSTSESIELLQNGQADMLLAGRTLKPNEPQMNYLLIHDGYSLLNNKSMTIYEKNLEDYDIYTDLDTNKIKENFSIENIIKVRNVYEYLNRGIIITSWENTDYTKAKMIHLLKNDGQRVAMARRPMLYCPDTCGTDAHKIVNLIKKIHPGSERE